MVNARSPAQSTGLLHLGSLIGGAASANSACASPRAQSPPPQPHRGDRPRYRPRAGAGREGVEIITSQPSPRLYQGFSLLVPNEMLDTPTTPGPLKLNHVSLPG